MTEYQVCESLAACKEKYCHKSQLYCSPLQIAIVLSGV